VIWHDSIFYHRYGHPAIIDPVVVEFHDAADEILNYQGHEGSPRLFGLGCFLGGLGGERFQTAPPLPPIRAHCEKP
jgi:hypothetical protein